MNNQHDPTADSSTWDARHHITYTSPHQQLLHSPQGQPALLPMPTAMSTTYPPLMPASAAHAHPSLGYHPQSATHGSPYVYPSQNSRPALQHIHRHTAPEPPAFLHCENSHMPSAPPSVSQHSHSLMHAPSRPYGLYAAQTYPSLMPTIASRSPPVQSSALSQDSSSDAVVPTYHGLIKTNTDAILLLAACDLPAEGRNPAEADHGSMMRPSPPPRRIRRRLLEHERPNLIRPGNVFVWEEKEAGMRRWTDGRTWSASRVSNNFLTYRELELRKRPATDGQGPRANQYKVEGLIKQSFSLQGKTSKRRFHVVSYYTKRDLRQGTLRRVSEDPRFVGEAGGEWGLSVDEVEYADPAAQDQGRCETTNNSPALDTRDQSLTADAISLRTGTAPSSPRDGMGGSPRLRCSAGSPQSPSFQFGGLSHAYPGPSRPFSTKPIPQKSENFLLPAAGRASTSISRRRPSSQDEVDNAGEATLSLKLDVRPALKRKRSSSTGEVYPRASTSATAARHGRLSDSRGPGLSGNLLTESNVRGANLGGPPMSRKLTAPGLLTPSTYTEQDSAAGVLLSLRGSVNEQISTTNPTPLTTPGDLEHNESSAFRKQLSGQGSSTEAAATSSSTPGDRPKGPDRRQSDREALDKLSIRL